MSFEPFVVPPTVEPPVRIPLQPHITPSGSPFPFGLPNLSREWERVYLQTGVEGMFPEIYIEDATSQYWDMAALRDCIGDHEIGCRDHTMQERCIKLYDLGQGVGSTHFPVQQTN